MSSLPPVPYDEARCMSCDEPTEVCVCMPTDEDVKRVMLRDLVAYRRQVLREAADMVLNRSSMWPDGMVSGRAVADELRRLADA